MVAKEGIRWQYPNNYTDDDIRWLVQVITLWFDVQRTWSHLESIFVGSEDIRQQLPVDSERFDDTNKRFVAKLKVITRIPNIIEATSTPGLAEELEVIQSQLSLFEKALAEYLETKRLAFPRLGEEKFTIHNLLTSSRFYFASSADLLDMLSNGEMINIFSCIIILNLHQGNQPMLVAKHLTKLFDSMAKIKMEDATRFAISSLIFPPFPFRCLA